MKRRRHTLQVSTFPFLAVLLCAMGSLILLLLVIDRRARVVARAKALQAAVRIEAEDAQRVAERQAELERRRQALHAALLRQQEELRGKVQTVEAHVEDAVRSSHVQRTHYQELKGRLESETARLAQKQALLAAGRDKITRNSNLSQESRHEMARMATELEQLEKTLIELRALKRREQPAYSIVPYKGKRGDSRRPIYIECTSSGLIFHPERVVLNNVTNNSGDVRTEIERRIALQRAAKDSNDSAGTRDSSYVLMLVRPDGLVAYYQVQSAIDGLKIDYGYEFIEADWVLDFPSDESDPRTSPWKIAVPTATPREGPAAATARIGPVKGFNFGAPAGVGHAGAAANSGSPRRPAFASGGGAGDPSAAPSGIRTTGPGGGSGLNDAVTGQAATGNPPTGTLPHSPGNTSAAIRPGSAAIRPGSVSDGQSVTVGGTVAAVPAPSFGGSGGIGVANAGGGSGTPQASGTSAPRGGMGGAAGVPGGSPNPGATAGPGGANLGGVENRFAVTPLIAAAGSTPPTTPTQPGTPAGQGAAGSGQPGSSQPGSGQPGQGPKGEGQADPYARPLVSAPETSRETPPVRPGWLSGNRDWIIPIECSADAVLIRSTGQKIPLDKLSNGIDNLLARSIKQLIDRRQASVPAGVPPYRPILRFVVKANGSKAYFLAYPALGHLKLPMTRMNLEPEDESRGGNR